MWLHYGTVMNSRRGPEGDFFNTCIKKSIQDSVGGRNSPTMEKNIWIQHCHRQYWKCIVIQSKSATSSVTEWLFQCYRRKWWSFKAFRMASLSFTKIKSYSVGNIVTTFSLLLMLSMKTRFWFGMRHPVFFDWISGF